MLYFDIDHRGQVNKRVVNLLPIDKTARSTDTPHVFEITLAVAGRAVPRPAPLYLVFVLEHAACCREEVRAAVLGYLEELFGPDYAEQDVHVAVVAGEGTPAFSQSLPELAALVAEPEAVESGGMAAARALLDTAPAGAHKAIVLVSGDEDGGAEQVGAARAARDAGIIIQAVATGERVPDTLHEVDSNHRAYLLPQHQGTALIALLHEFTQAVLFANNNIMLTDYIVRRGAEEEEANDGSFTLDTHSLEVAYLRWPGEAPEFRRVDLDASAQAALTLKENFSVLNFSVGRLWPEKLTAGRSGRFCLALLRYRLLVNPGVHSGSFAQPLPTNFTATVDWTELGEPLLQLFPVPSVYVPPCAVSCSQPLACPCYLCRCCYPCHPCQPCWAGCGEVERPVNWSSCWVINRG